MATKSDPAELGDADECRVFLSMLGIGPKLEA
jgi:hypothetical protein